MKNEIQRKKPYSNLIKITAKTISYAKKSRSVEGVVNKLTIMELHLGYGNPNCEPHRTLNQSLTLSVTYILGIS